MSISLKIVVTVLVLGTISGFAYAATERYLFRHIAIASIGFVLGFALVKLWMS